MLIMQIFYQLSTQNHDIFKLLNKSSIVIFVFHTIMKEQWIFYYLF